MTETVMPLHAEQAAFKRVRKTTGTVRVATATRLRDHVIEEMLAEDHASVLRVDIGVVIDTVPDVRQEGDTTIIPVVEEVVVVEKKLFLKQEIRITRSRTMQPYREVVTLREQTAEITRTSGDGTLDLTPTTGDGDQDGQ